MNINLKQTNFTGILSALTDVNVSPSDQDALIWDDATSKWIAQAPDHDSLTNTHNLTTDIDHDALTNFLATEHFILGETSATAYRGDRGTAAYNHISASGSSHSYINQGVTTASKPTFAGFRSTGSWDRASGTQTVNITTAGINFVMAATMRCARVYLTTTGSTANMYVSSGGYFKRKSSSIRYKGNIKDLELNSSLIYQLRPVSFNSKCDGDDKERRFHGLVSEEIERIYPDIIEYDDKGRVEGFDSGMLQTLMLAEIQRHEARIKELEVKLNN